MTEDEWTKLLKPRTKQWTRASTGAFVEFLAPVGPDLRIATSFAADAETKQCVVNIMLRYQDFMKQASDIEARMNKLRGEPRKLNDRTRTLRRMHGAQRKAINEAAETLFELETYFYDRYKDRFVEYLGIALLVLETQNDDL